MQKMLNNLRTKKRHRSAILVFTILIMLYANDLLAGGRYRVLLDETGILFQTEGEGGWYIPEEDQAIFKPGQTGRYSFGRDAKGRYLDTDRGRFYLNDKGGREYDSADENDGHPQEHALHRQNETEVILAGQHVLIPVLIKHSGRTLTVNLLLDTGASIITLHKESVRRLRFNAHQNTHFTTASGSRIEADLVQLDNLRFGPYEKTDILAGIIEYQKGDDAGYDGLLGMNALRGIHYEIDYEKGVVRWMN